MNRITQAPGHSRTQRREFTIAPFIWAMTKEEILEAIPGTYDSGDGDPFRLFPGPSMSSPLAARLARVAFHWQIQPMDAVRALAPGGHRFTYESVVLWMLGERTLAPWEARSLGRLVRMLEHPESEEHVRAWWRTVREYLAWELAAYERREAWQQRRVKESVEPGEAVPVPASSHPPTMFPHPSCNKECDS